MPRSPPFPHTLSTASSSLHNTRCSFSCAFALLTCTEITTNPSVRTSAEFNVNRDGVYGNLSADPRLENLWHVASCSSGQAFAMDFEFRGGGGGAQLEWSDEADTSSIVQVRACRH